MTERFWLMTAVVSPSFADWLTVGFSWRKAEYILKPAATAMVILWTCFTAGWTFEVLLILFILGQTAAWRDISHAEPALVFSGFSLFSGSPVLYRAYREANHHCYP